MRSGRSARGRATGDEHQHAASGPIRHVDRCQPPVAPGGRCGVWPVALPLVDGKVEGVVGDIDADDLVRLDGEQQRLDRRPLPPGRGQSAEVLGVLPVQGERDEPASVALVVEGQMLIDEVDAVSRPFTCGSN